MLSSVLMLALEQSQAKDLESESLEFLFVPFSAKAVLPRSKRL